MHIIPYSIPTFMHLCDKSSRVEEHCMQRTLQSGEPPTRLFVFIKFLEAV